MRNVECVGWYIALLHMFELCWDLEIVFLFFLDANVHGLLKGLRQFTTSCLRKQEGEDANNDGAASHDQEWKKVGDSVKVSHGGSKQGSEPGQGGASSCNKYSIGFNLTDW